MHHPQYHNHHQHSSHHHPHFHGHHRVHRSSVSTNGDSNNTGSANSNTDSISIGTYNTDEDDASSGGGGGGTGGGGGGANNSNNRGSGGNLTNRGSSLGDTPSSSCISCTTDTPNSCISPQDPLAALREEDGGGGGGGAGSGGSGGGNRRVRGSRASLSADEFGSKCTMTNSPDCFGGSAASPSSGSSPDGKAVNCSASASSSASASDSAVNTAVDRGGGRRDVGDGSSSGFTGSNCDVSVEQKKQQQQQQQQQQVEEDDCFALALANRSACLQRLGSHRHAISDIDLALASGYPENKVGHGGPAIIVLAARIHLLRCVSHADASRSSGVIPSPDLLCQRKQRRIEGGEPLLAS